MIRLTGWVTMLVIRLLTSGAAAVIGARRNLSGVCRRWYPFILELHRFLIADDCESTAPGLLVLFPRGVGWFMVCATI